MILLYSQVERRMSNDTLVQPGRAFVQCMSNDTLVQPVERCMSNDTLVQPVERRYVQ